MSTRNTSIVVLFLACLVTLHGQTDEDSLKQTYYKHAFLVSMEPAVKSATMAHGGRPVNQQELTRQLDTSRLDISLSNVKTGPIQELLDQPWVKFYDVPVPPQEVLQVNISTSQFQDFDQPQVSWQVGKATWIPADPAPPQDMMDVINKWTVGRILTEEQKRLNNNITYTRYATYVVTIHFQGKTVTYKAMAFLATVGGEVKALPEDGYMLSNAFSVGNSLDVFPTALLHSSLAHEYAPLQQWLRKNTVSDDSCRKGRREFCCTGNSCGIASTDLENELAKPADGRKP